MRQIQYDIRNTYFGINEGKKDEPDLFKQTKPGDPFTLCRSRKSITTSSLAVRSAMISKWHSRFSVCSKP